MMSLLSINMQAFKAIVENGTVHGAASSLGLSQTAVTQRIKSLEKELGKSLFQRSRKGMLLTHEGEALYTYCIQSSEIEGKALAVFNNSGLTQDVDITLVGPTSTLVTRIPEQCVSIFQKFPKLNLHFIFDDQSNCIQYLKTGKAQFAILQNHQVVNELDSKVLQPEKFILAASSSWKNRSLKKILQEERMIDFYEDDQTTISYLRNYNLLSEVKRPRLFVNNNKSLIDLACAGLGYVTLTKKIAEPYLKAKKLIALNQGKSLNLEIALAWYPRLEKPDYIESIIKSLK